MQDKKIYHNENIAITTEGYHGPPPNFFLNKENQMTNDKPENTRVNPNIPDFTHSEHDGSDLTRNGYNGPPPQPIAEIKPASPPPTPPEQK